MRRAESAGAQESAKLTPRSQGDPSRRMVPWAPSTIPITVRPRCREIRDRFATITFGLNGLKPVVEVAEVAEVAELTELTSMILGPMEREPIVSVTMRTFGPADWGTGWAAVALPVDVRPFGPPDESMTIILGSTGRIPAERVAGDTSSRPPSSGTMGVGAVLGAGLNPWRAIVIPGPAGASLIVGTPTR